jgi:hypothetical protein
MNGEVSPAVADGQGDTEEGEGNVSKIRESYVGEGAASLVSLQPLITTYLNGLLFSR